MNTITASRTPETIVADVIGVYRTPDEYVADANNRIIRLWNSLVRSGVVQGRSPTIEDISSFCAGTDYKPEDVINGIHKSHNNNDNFTNLWEAVFMRIGDIARSQVYRRALTREEIDGMTAEEKTALQMCAWHYLFAIQNIGLCKGSPEVAAMHFCHICDMFDAVIAPPDPPTETSNREFFDTCNDRAERGEIPPVIPIPDFEQFHANCLHAHELILENHRKATDHLKAPVVPLLVEWYKYQCRVTEEDDRRTPGAILHQNSSGALRPHWHTNDRNDMVELPQLEQPPEAAQFHFDGIKPNHTIIPAGGLSFSVSPGVTPIQRIGQVPVPFSTVEEGLFLLPPKITSGEFSIELGELTRRIFYYNNRVYDKNRELVIAGLNQLYDKIWVHYEDPSGGGSGKWHPLVPLNPPTPGAKDNYLVYIYVSTPYGHTGGYVIEKYISRQLRSSLMQSNLYRTGSAFFDKLGNVDSTIPIEPPRNTDPNPKKQYYIREDGTPYLDQRGKPITDLYHSDLTPQLDRKDNPKAKYREHLWDTKTIICAGRIDYEPRNKSAHLKRALSQLYHLTQLSDEKGNTNPPLHVEVVTTHGDRSPISNYRKKSNKGRIVIEPPPHFAGIYVIPTTRHINLKRAVYQSSRHRG